MDGQQWTGAESCSWPRTVPFSRLHPAFALFPPGRSPLPVIVPHLLHYARSASGGLVAQSAVAPPGPIPNPVVTHRSAGEYCGVAPREARPLRAPPMRTQAACGILKQA